MSDEDIEEHKLEVLIKKLDKIELISEIRNKYPTYKVEKVFKGLNPGEYTIIGSIGEYAIDLFLVKDTDTKDNIQKGFQDWQSIFLAKLKMGRVKDIKDLVNFKMFNPSNESQYAQQKGFRHFNFKKITKDKIFRIKNYRN